MTAFGIDSGPPHNSTATPLPLSIALLGRFSVHVHGVPLRKLRTRQGERLLALLALRSSREQSRTILAAQLWPDSSSETNALALLRRALTDLRDALGPEASCLQSLSQSSLILNLGNRASLDADEFDKAITSGARKDLDRAIELYQGPLMPDLKEEYDPDGTIQGERVRLHHRFLDALERRAAILRRQGDAQAAIVDLRRLLATDPLRETAFRALMELLADTGQRAAAQAEYQQLRQRLAKSLGAKPEQETRRVYERLQGSGDTTSLPLTVDPPRPDAPKHNLPYPLTSFIGREREIAAIRGLQQTTRLLTLTGTGGSGKTRLSLQVAASALEEYPDGTYLVEFASVSEPSLVPQTVASALRVREQYGQEILRTLADTIGRKRVLLLLDNAEHLLLACARFAATILRSCPQASVMVTSREPLGIVGELSYRVPPLSMPGLQARQAATPATVAPFESVRLFVERAQFVRPDFVLTAGNAATVAHLCCRLDGIPLAIEMAAVCLRSLTVEEITGQLDDRFRLLTGGDRSSLPRQQTLRAVVDWSYDLLRDSEKILLARVSVFAGGWTLAAAESVCHHAPLADENILALLTRLVDTSLVLADAGTAGTTRYRLLETMLQYATEILPSYGEVADLQKRHTDWCVALTEEAERHLTGPDQAQWLDRLENEHDNLREALDRCSSGTPSTNTALQGLRLAGALWRFWQMRGYLSEGRDYLNRLLAGRDLILRKASGARPEATEAITAKRVVAKAFGAAGILTSSGGDYEASRSLQEECLKLYQEIDDNRGIADALANLGLLAYSQGDGAMAWALLSDSLARSREMGDPENIARSLNNLGIVAAYNRNDFKTARSLHEESLALFRAMGNIRGIANTLNSMGIVALSQGDDHRACLLLAESLERFREIGDTRGIKYGLEGVAAVYHRQEKTYRAAVIWAVATALRESQGTPLPTAEQEKQERNFAQGRAVLGEAAWREAWMQGRRMTYEQAIDFATADLDCASNPSPLV